MSELLVTLLFIILVIANFYGKNPILTIFYFYVNMVLLTGFMLLLLYFDYVTVNSNEPGDGMFYADILFLLMPILIIGIFYFYRWLHKEVPVLIITTVRYEVHETPQKNNQNMARKKIVNINGEVETHKWPYYQTWCDHRSAEELHSYTDNLLNKGLYSTEVFLLISRHVSSDGSVVTKYSYMLIRMVFATPREYDEPHIADSDVIVRINNAQYTLFYQHHMADVFGLLPSRVYTLVSQIPPIPLYSCLYYKNASVSNSNNSTVNVWEYTCQNGYNNVDGVAYYLVFGIYT